MSIFDIPIQVKDNFMSSFQQATMGPGQEFNRINRLKSSSLLALLSFWNVSEDTPFYYQGICYTKVVFEVENPVFRSNSSIDIMLISNDNKKLLFLESKFSEPLAVKKRYALKEAYHDLYCKFLSDSLNVGEVFEKKNKRDEIIRQFYISSSDGNRQYLDGIKQMVSHLYGIIKSDDYLSADEIRLGTILYKFEDSQYPEYYSQFWSKNHSLKTKIANHLGKSISKLSVIETPIYYQEAFKGRNSSLLTEKVKMFYRL